VNGVDQGVAQVLIIEDDAAAARLLQKHLEKHDHQVVVAGSGEAGLLVLGLPVGMSVTVPPTPASFSPSLLVCDLSLPGMSGAMVIETLRAEDTTRSLPVLVVSGRSAVQDHALALEVGADAFLPKPLRMKDFDDAVAGLLQGRSP
jgi:DNA-binding response OmpR family regulator